MSVRVNSLDAVPVKDIKAATRKARSLSNTLRILSLTDNALNRLRLAISIHLLGIDASHFTRLPSLEEAERSISNYRQKQRKGKSLREKRNRRDRVNLPVIGKIILSDLKAKDRHKRRENDLTYEFILDQISKPCSYCGNSKMRMTIDRVDNSIGHLMSNVIPSCVRCNSIRMAMPYNAWLHIVPGIKSAFETGLFENWKEEFSVQNESE